MTQPPHDSLGGPPASKTAYTLERLRREIADGAIRPGEALRQADLAKRYGVSPTPVREALRLLEAEGAISYSPHRGAAVSELTEDRVSDLYLLRAATESLVTRLAAERRTDEQLAEIQDLHQRLNEFTETGDTSHQQLAAWNRELHLLIGTSGSPLIATQVMNLWRMFPTGTTMWKEPDLCRCFLDQHDAIIKAIAASDGPAAEELMAEHILTGARERLRLMN